MNLLTILANLFRGTQPRQFPGLDSRRQTQPLRQTTTSSSVECGALIQPIRPGLQIRRAYQGPVRTVRVLRICEPGMGSQTAGRMVMSGRMADVCAELERLAA